MQTPTTSIYILKYNNYYNRIVKKEENLSTYLNYNYYGPLTGTNFVPNDGVNTKHTIGSYPQKYDGLGDYLLVVNELQEIVSRWFIIEARMVRGGQWDLTLHRDLIVDYYEPIIKADTFIEKATLNLDDPLIFNKENMFVNQIKTSETLLKDQSGCAWLVGYYANDATGINGTVNQNLLTDVPYVDIGYDFADWPLRNYTNIPLAGQETKIFYGNPTSGNYYINAQWTGSPLVTDVFIKSIFDRNNVKVSPIIGNVGAGLLFVNEATAIKRLNSIYNEKLGSLNSQLSAYIDIHTESEVKNLLTLNGKLIRTNDGKIFNCVVEETRDISTGRINPPQNSGLYITLENIALEAGMALTGDGPTTKNFEFEIKRSKFSIYLTEQKFLELNYSISDSNKLITSDAPWNIFAIPYSNDLTIKGAGTDFTTNMQVAIDTATSIAKQHGSKVYDIQLLPYCPVPSLITDDNEITVENAKQYSLVSKNEDNYNIIFNVPTARFNTTLTNYNFPIPSSNIERKLNNECDKWRLTAPNYSNYFDFSVEKNNGIESFDIDCEYKPFTPYIHINPVFGGLYGYDDNSPRGLVLGGDFSLSRINDQWIEYEIQNKNFQNTFDRQIQNMEVQQDVQRIKDITGAITGTIIGTAAGTLTGGTLTGSMAGNGGIIGSIVGGAIGGVGSAVGGIVDYNLNEQLRNETLDYTKDMFGYQLGNIQALPNTISKISSLNNNNKLFPILEYYTCTEREKLAFLNKVAYNGMTVMAIGKIENYIYNRWDIEVIESKGYIKGKIIRIDLEEDYHITKAIADEINKGAFFQ